MERVDRRRGLGVRMKRTVLLVGVFAMMALVLASCGDDADNTTTTTTTATAATGGGNVVFGEGELPEGFPADFPIPEGANIGSTLVTDSRTEVALVAPDSIENVAAFYEAELPGVGYEVVSVEANRITFTDTGIEGTVGMTAANPTLTQVVIQLDTV